MYGSFAQVYPEEDIVSQPHAGVQSLVSISIPRTPDLEWLGRPTVMTDRWCHNMIPGAARDRILTDSESGSPPDGNAAEPPVPTLRETSNRVTYDTIPASLSSIDQALFQGSLAWINPDFLINPHLPSKYGLARKKVPLSFGIGRPPASYVYENEFSSDPSNVVPSDVGIDR